MRPPQTIDEICGPPTSSEPSDNQYGHWELVAYTDKRGQTHTYWTWMPRQKRSA